MKRSNRPIWRRISRPMIMTGLTLLLAMTLVARLFVLQIVRGDAYNDQFKTRTTKRISIPGKRGRILDRNGNVIADTRTVENIAMVDVTGNSSSENERLNRIIRDTVDLLKSHGESLDVDFGIVFDGLGYVFTDSGAEQLRFVADVYGYADPATMTEEEKNSTAGEIVQMLAERYRIDTGDTSAAGMSLLLDTVSVRYALSLNAFAKYNETILSRDVGDATVQAVLDAEDLDGVSVSNSYAREYSDSMYLSSVTGYTSLISQEELEERGDGYSAGDYTGTVGIEASMEDLLHGADGYREISVDNMGREQGEVSYQRPGEGTDITLTIDTELQKAVYQIIEKNLSLILLDRITDSIDAFDPDEDTSSDDYRIPANDVYGALLAYTIDRDHLYADDASEHEQSLLESMNSYLDDIKETLREDLRAEGDDAVTYADQSSEYKTYYTYIIQALYDRGILIRDNIDTDNDVYSDWTGSGSVSAGEFLREAVREGWIDLEAVRDSVDVPGDSSDFEALIEYICAEPCEDYSFCTRTCRYLLRNDYVDGTDICMVMFDQGLYTPSDSVARDIENGSEYAAYQYIRDMIASRSITPAQLYLYPYSASAVVTDVESGEVLALVSYPGYDAGKLSDSEYMDRIIMDPTKPMLNSATQQRTAPGSTYKIVTSCAGLMEGVITTDESLYCGGIFEEIDPSPKCWIYPGRHGSLNLSGGIANSCNLYFYQVGYRLGLEEGAEEGGADAGEDSDEYEDADEDDDSGDDEKGDNDGYNSELGTSRLASHAASFGLEEQSGVEIEEADPVTATRDSVRAAIGQSNNSFTTTQLARYVTDIANSGADRPITLIKDRNTGVKPREELDIGEEAWDAIHDGMRRVVRNRSYFSSLYTKDEDGQKIYLDSAGKTGTAQQGAGRPNHALFIGYAPYDEPEISIAARIPNGYTSDYAARVSGQIMQYYFDPQSLHDLMQDEYIGGNGGGD